MKNIPESTQTFNSLGWHPRHFFGTEDFLSWENDQKIFSTALILSELGNNNTIIDNIYN